MARPALASVLRAVGGEFGPLRQVLAYPMFRRYATADFPAMTGTWMQRLALGWLTWELTGSPTWLGMIAFADLIPAVFVGPLSGVLVDRNSPRRIGLLALAIQVAQAFAMFLLALFGMVDVWLLFGLTLVRGTAAALFQPSRLALVPQLVPSEGRSSALATCAVNFNTARLIGPALAGVAITHVGVSVCFAANALALFWFWVTLYRLDVPEPVRDKDGSRPSIIGELAMAARYAAARTEIRTVFILLAIGATFGRPITDLLPAYAGDVFARGAEGLAWMTASTGLGAILGGYSIVRRGGRRGVASVLVTNMLSLGVLLIAFTHAPQFWMACVVLVALGHSLSVNGVASQCAIQEVCEDRLLGRVMGFYGAIVRAGPAVGAVVIGAIADHLGLSAPVTGAAVICIAAWVWVMIRKRRLLADGPAGEAAEAPAKADTTRDT